jgi:hypothetical protein
MKGRMRNNPTEKDKYGRSWFVVFRMHAVRQACRAKQAGSIPAVPAAMLNLTAARPEQVLQVGGALD